MFAKKCSLTSEHIHAPKDLLGKVEEAFDHAKKEIIERWQQELKAKYNLPDLSSILTYLHDSTSLIKKIYTNDVKDVGQIPQHYTTLKPLEGVDVAKLIKIAQLYVPEVEAAIKQAQDDFRTYEVD